MLSLGNKLTLTTQPIYKFVNKYSIDFDGVDDRIITDGADTVAQPTTYSFWCKSSEGGANMGVFGHGAQAIGGFHLNVGNKPLLYLNGNYYRYWDDTPAQDDGEWHHWVVYSDTNDITNSKLYIDGVLQTVQSTVTSDGTSLAYTESLTIGSERQVGGNSFEGQIDEFAVYDRELTQAEITRMYNTYYSPNRVANGNFSQIGNEEVTNGDFSQIGSELVTNGDFATDSDWSYNASYWNISGGTANALGVANGGFSQTLSVTSGKIYKVQISSTITSGNGIYSVSLGTNQEIFDNNTSEITTYIKASGDNVNITIHPGASAFSMSSVSVKEVGQGFTFGDGWGMGENKAIFDATVVNKGISQEGILTSGKFYKISLDINVLSGTLSSRLRFFDSNTSGTTISNITSSGTYTFYALADKTGFQLISLSDNTAEYTVTNFTFKEVGQHWTAASNWTIDGDKATADGSSTGNLVQTLANVVVGKTYKIQYNVSNYSAGVLRFYYGGVFTAFKSANGSYSETIIATSTDATLTTSISSTFAGSVDNIVVQELKHDATNLMLNAGAYQSANPLITSTKSMEFDGTDDFLRINSTIGSITGSISFWVKPDSLGTDRYLYDARGVGNTGVGYAYLNNSSSIVSVSSGTVYVNGIASTSITTGVWQYIVITGVTLDIDTDIVLGARYNTADRFFDGEMTEVGLWDRTLTALEVASLYNQGMPTNLLVNRNNYQSGNPTVFNTKQVDFDGSDDYLKVTNNYGSFTGSISMWFKRDNTGNPMYLIDARGDSANGTGYIIVNSSVFTVSSGTRYVDGVAQTTMPTDANWHHMVVTGITLDIDEDLKIGSRYNQTEELEGNISQVGLWNSTLTADEVSSLYNHGLPIDLTTNQAAYASSSNLVGYWRMGSGTLDSYPLIADQTNATLGSELVTNGDFATDSGWTKGTGVTISNGVATSDGTSGNYDNILVGTISGTWNTSLYYEVSVEVKSYTSGSFKLNNSTHNITDAISSAGTHTVFWSPTTANSVIGVQNFGTPFNGTIDNITVKQVQGNPAIMTNQTSSDIENGSPYANIVQNGTFDTDSDWTKETGWTISGGTANYSGGSSNRNIRQAIGITNGKTYKIQYQVTAITSGEVACRFGGMSGVNEITATTTGTYVGYITANSSANGELLIEDNDNNFVGSIDNVTVEEVNTGLQGYWKMGDGTNDEYPVIYDQVDPTLGSDISVCAGEDANVGAYATIENNTTTSLVSGKMYRVAFTVSNYTSGSFKFKQPSGGVDLGITGNANGDYVQYGIATNNTELDCSAFNLGFVGTIGNYSVQELSGNPATMTNMVDGNITNQYPLTKIRNYYRMGDGILDGYPIIQDQTSPNLAHIPTTNEVTYSEDFSNAFWTSSATTYGTVDSVNLVTAPDGTTTAQKWTRTSGTYNLIRPVSNITGTYYTQSVFVKNIDADNFYLRGSSFYSYNFSNKTVSDSSLKVEYLANDWIRLYINNPHSTFKQFGIGENETDSTELNHSVYVWGCQIESQGQATPYLKSDGIAAVRKSSTTNLIPYSEDFENAAWSTSELSFGSKVTSPIGTNDAITIIEIDATAQHNIYDEIVGFTNEAYTLSCYAKLGTSSNRGIFLRVRDGNTSGTSYGIAWYNLSDGTFTMSGGISANIENVNNGWYRCSLTVTAPSGNSLCLIGLANGNSNYYDGDGTSNVLIWGSQVEKQTQAETYAKTTGLPVTIDLFTENNYGTMTNMSASDIVEDTP